MRKILASVTIAVATVAGAVFATHASAATTTAHPTATSKTCAAYRAWNAHRTTARLDAMVTASLAASWHNLGNDVDVVYADVRGGNHYDLPGDVAGIKADCKGR